jgi:LmbE family N-acetylglucosaminyl deacetylase
MTSYHSFVSTLDRLLKEGKSYQLGGFTHAPHPPLPAAAPTALIFSPHPDDECIIGGVAIRLLREVPMRVVNVAVTQGSRKDRQAGRLQELAGACDYLGFDLVTTVPNGLEKINPKTRQGDPAHWSAAVDVIAAIVAEHRPAVALFPHETDWNSSHIGTHHLVVDALKKQAPGFTCHTIETEFWGAMADPNLMVESTVDDLARMMEALSFHVEEVRRNPYHLLVPAWMQDNVRRGGELVGGQGGAAPDFSFSTLYRHRVWKDGAFQPLYQGGRLLAASESAATLFA